MGKRFTDTELDDKAWFRALPCRLKCLWRYLCNKCDAAGVWETDFDLASFQIGENVSEMDMSYFGDRVEKLSSGKWWLTTFISFQYSELTEACKPHRHIISLCHRHGIYERVSKGLRKGFETLQDKDKDKDKDSSNQLDGGVGEDSGLPADNVRAISVVGNIAIAIKKKSPTLDVGRVRAWIDAEIKHGATEAQILEWIKDAPANFQLWGLKPKKKASWETWGEPSEAGK